MIILCVIILILFNMLDCENILVRTFSANNKVGRTKRQLLPIWESHTVCAPIWCILAKKLLSALF